MTQKDGFTNLVSAIGAANGKTGANTYVPLRLGQQDLDSAYRSSTWFGKIVDIPADDATREWRQWNADKAQIELLEATEKRLNVRVKVNQALRWARLYGGAVIIPDLPGRPASAVNLDRVTATSVRFLHVLSRYEIRAEGIIRDPLSPNYGQPEYYEVNGDQGVATRFHPSRVILINGRRPGTLDHSNEVWGDPIWHNLSDAVHASDSSAAVVAALMQEAKIDVVQVDGLMDGMATAAYEDKFMRRWDLVARLKSVANVTLIDKMDEWQQKSVSFGGIPDTVMTLLTIMAGAADIPVTRLIGTSAGGLNATGEGDLRNYYDAVKANQDLRISPMLSPLDEIIIRDALGTRPPEVWYDWRALWQPDQKTQAETQKIRAETYQIELNTGAIDEEALTKAYLNGAIESGLYPGLEAAIEDSANEGLATEEQQNAAAAELAVVPVTPVADALPRTLYVRRDVVNTAEITKWAKEQGFTDIVPDLHVTVLYSKTPVDWIAMGNSWDSRLTFPEGGPRIIEAFGEAKVLAFAGDELVWRHNRMVEAGASHDFPDYQPHITISYGPLPANVTPYQGKLVFGPEIFEEVKGG